MEILLLDLRDVEPGGCLNVSDIRHGTRGLDAIRWGGGSKKMRLMKNKAAPRRYCGAAGKLSRLAEGAKALCEPKLR